MDEQERNDEVERECGSIARAFQLMRIHTTATQAASGNAFTLRKLPDATERFRNMAKRAGYSEAAINAYLRL